MIRDLENLKVFRQKIDISEHPSEATISLTGKRKDIGLKLAELGETMEE